MTEMEIVAKNMRLLRTKLDISQAKLAEKVGVSEQTIYLYERAERSMPLDKVGNYHNAAPRRRKKSPRISPRALLFYPPGRNVPRVGCWLGLAVQFRRLRLAVLPVPVAAILLAALFGAVATWHAFAFSWRPGWASEAAEALGTLGNAPTCSAGNNRT